MLTSLGFENTRVPDILRVKKHMSAIDWTPLFENYKGLWVALKEDERTVVGSGKTLKEALERANASGVAQPIVTRVPEKMVTFIGSYDFSV